jgi:Skp family chaperone for outer membrane proteins
MQYVQKSVASVASVVLALSVAGAALAQGAAPAAKASIGVVDRDKVITSFKKAQSAAEELKRVEENVRKLLEDSNKQYEEAKTAKKPQAELEGLQKRLQLKIDEEYKKAQGRAQNLETQLETDIDDAIKAEAASRKMDTVFMKGAVLLGGTDITEGVVKRLSASASATGGAAAPAKTVTK